MLIAEDDPNDVFFLRRAFGKLGLESEVEIVEDGDAVIAYLKGVGLYGDRARHPLPSLIVLDLKLPRKSGLEVLEWIRADPKVGATPVIVLTSSEQRSDIERAKTLGIAAYIVKPVGFEGFLGAARTIAHWRKPAEAPPAP